MESKNITVNLIWQEGDIPLDLEGMGARVIFSSTRPGHDKRFYAIDIGDSEETLVELKLKYGPNVWQR